MVSEPTKGISDSVSFIGLAAGFSYGVGIWLVVERWRQI